MSMMSITSAINFSSTGSPCLSPVFADLHQSHRACVSDLESFRYDDKTAEKDPNNRLALMEASYIYHLTKHVSPPMIEDKVCFPVALSKYDKPYVYELSVVVVVSISQVRECVCCQ